jgi:hypothetical protein
MGSSIRHSDCTHVRGATVDRVCLDEKPRNAVPHQLEQPLAWLAPLHPSFHNYCDALYRSYIEDKQCVYLDADIRRNANLDAPYFLC